MLRRAQQLDWAEDSAKALVVIGDDVPHPPSYTDQHVFWRDELGVLTGMGVKVTHSGFVMSSILFCFCDLQLSLIYIGHNVVANGSR